MCMLCQQMAPVQAGSRLTCREVFCVSLFLFFLVVFFYTLSPLKNIRSGPANTNKTNQNKSHCLISKDLVARSYLEQVSQLLQWPCLTWISTHFCQSDVKFNFIQKQNIYDQLGVAVVTTPYHLFRIGRVFFKHSCIMNKMCV